MARARRSARPRAGHAHSVAKTFAGRRGSIKTGTFGGAAVWKVKRGKVQVGVNKRTGRVVYHVKEA